MSTPTVGEQLAVINTKLDALLLQRDDHEVRIRRLERWMYLLTGAAAALGSAAGSMSARFLA